MIHRWFHYNRHATWADENQAFAIQYCLKKRLREDVQLELVVCYGHIFLSRDSQIVFSIVDFGAFVDKRRTFYFHFCEWKECCVFVRFVKANDTQWKPTLFELVRSSKPKPFRFHRFSYRNFYSIRQNMFYVRTSSYKCNILYDKKGNNSIASEQLCYPYPICLDSTVFPKLRILLNHFNVCKHPSRLTYTYRSFVVHWMRRNRIFPQRTYCHFNHRRLLSDGFYRAKCDQHWVGSAPFVRVRQWRYLWEWHLGPHIFSRKIIRFLSGIIQWQYFYYISTTERAAIKSHNTCSCDHRFKY